MCVRVATLLRSKDGKHTKRDVITTLIDRIVMIFVLLF